MGDSIFGMACGADEARDEATLQTRKRIAELEAEVLRLKPYEQLADELAEALKGTLHTAANRADGDAALANLAKLKGTK